MTISHMIASLKTKHFLFKLKEFIR